MTQVYSPLVGENIEETARALVQLVRTVGQPARAEFNGVELHAYPATDSATIVALYNAECDRRRIEYEASPEGKQAAIDRAEYQKRADAAEAEGIKLFSLKDANGWQKTVEINTDRYGACTIRYAARWANMMEGEMSRGKKLENVAKTMSYKADLEGITGFMYGCAVSILSQTWLHGEALRRWHNLDTQIKDEGERANKSGGVLNPALLSLG